MMKRIAVLLLSVFLLAACSGSGGATIVISDSTDDSVSKSELTAFAKVVDENSNKQFSKIKIYADKKEMIIIISADINKINTFSSTCSLAVSAVDKSLKENVTGPMDSLMIYADDVDSNSQIFWITQDLETGMFFYMQDGDVIWGDGDNDFDSITIDQVEDVLKDCY